MRLSGTRAGRIALFVGRALILVLVAVSFRAAYAPKDIVHKSETSKRPKFPKKVVRVEEFRVAVEEKQTPAPKLPHPEAAALDLVLEIARASVSPALPVTAFRQLTKPDYLQSHTPTSAFNPHAPPG